MLEFGSILEVDHRLIGAEISASNLLSYMGMIEQAVTELLLATGLAPVQQLSEHSQKVIDFHWPDHQQASDGSEDEAICDFRKKFDMKFNWELNYGQ